MAEKTEVGKLTVLVTVPVLEMLDAYVQEAEGEISGFGICEVTGDRVTVVELVVPKQVCGMAETEIGETELVGMMSELVGRGVALETVRLWWHSHVNMSAFWSGTDDKTAKELARRCGGWMVSIVCNKRGERRVRVDAAVGPVTVTVDELPLLVTMPAGDSVREAVRREVAEKVSVRKWAGYKWDGRTFAEVDGTDVEGESDLERYARLGRYRRPLFGADGRVIPDGPREPGKPGQVGWKGVYDTEESAGVPNAGERVPQSPRTPPLKRLSGPVDRGDGLPLGYTVDATSGMVRPMTEAEERAAYRVLMDDEGEWGYGG